MAPKVKCHELIEAIDSCSNWPGRRSNLDNLEKCIEKHEERGWDKNGDVPDAKPANRYPLIHWAAVLGKYMALKWLLKPENGFSFDVKSSEKGETALHTALELPFLQPKHRKASPELIRKFSKTVALLKNLLPIKDEENGNIPLHTAAKLLVNERSSSFFLGCFEVIIKRCKKMGNSVLDDVLNSTNNFGETALHILARGSEKKVESCTEAIQMLIAAGARSDIRNNKGLTALDIAARFKNKPITRELRKHTPVSLFLSCDDYKVRLRRNLLNFVPELLLTIKRAFSRLSQLADKTGWLSHFDGISVLPNIQT